MSEELEQLKAVMDAAWKAVCVALEKLQAAPEYKDREAAWKEVMATPESRACGKAWDSAWEKLRSTPESKALDDAEEAYDAAHKDYYVAVKKQKQLELLKAVMDAARDAVQEKLPAMLQYKVTPEWQAYQAAWEKLEAAQEYQAYQAAKEAHHAAWKATNVANENLMVTPEYQAYHAAWAKLTAAEKLKYQVREDAEEAYDAARKDYYVAVKQLQKALNAARKKLMDSPEWKPYSAAWEVYHAADRATSVAKEKLEATPEWQAYQAAWEKLRATPEYQAREAEQAAEERKLRVIEYQPSGTILEYMGFKKTFKKTIKTMFGIKELEEDDE
jgi:hypothetical protein